MDFQTAYKMAYVVSTRDEYLSLLEKNVIDAARDKGAIMAMKDAGIDPAEVPVVGIDATRDAREEIRSGAMAMTVFQDAKGQAEGAVASALNMLEGNPLGQGTDFAVSDEDPYVLYVPFVPVTAENVDDFAQAN